MPTPDLQSKRALVVGGSGGVGLAVCRELLIRGASLVVHGRDGERLERARRHLANATNPPGAEGIRTIAQPIDSADDWAAISQQMGEIDICVVSFGPFLERPLLETSSEEWRHVLELNTVLPARVVAELLPGMKQRGFGRIVIFGGTGTDQIRGYREIAAYSAAKTAAGVLVRSAARETGGGNVTVNAVCPGMVDTEYLDERQRRVWASRMPSGKLLAAADVAAAVGYLVSPENRATNGVLLPVDEGLMAR